MHQEQNTTMWTAGAAAPLAPRQQSFVYPRCVCVCEHQTHLGLLTIKRFRSESHCSLQANALA